MLVQDRAKQTRKLLLEAAYRVFVRDGFERARVDTIAQEAGRTKGALYAHFKSKEHLFVSLLEQRTFEAADRIDAVAARESEPDRFLKVLREAVIGMRDADWATLNLELKLYAIRHPSAAKRLRSAFRHIHEREAFTPLNRLSGESHAKVKLFALWSIVSAMVLDMSFDPKFMTRREASLLLGEVFDGLFPEGASSGAKARRIQESSPLTPAKSGSSPSPRSGSGAGRAK